MNVASATSLRDVAACIAASAHDLDTDLDPLIERASVAQVVLIGEATHGTDEFYRIRVDITKRLIMEKGFRLIALEADWPDALRAHRYASGQSEDATAADALGDFRRFPTWMWRNEPTVAFVEWLRDWNRARASCDRAGLFGLDLYSLRASMEAVLEYLEKTDPKAADRARHRYGCFELFDQDPHAYGYATTRGQADPCESEAIAQLVDLRCRFGATVAHDEPLAEDEFFYAEQNARLVANAEKYYRSMFQGRDASWNLRDEHMAGTLEALRQHYRGKRERVVVWAHNSHLGDARATQMRLRGEWNVGQLTRERYGSENVYAIGQSTYEGSVTAARDWGGKAERRRVLPGLSGSYEELLHAVGRPRFWLDLSEPSEATKALADPRLQRAIGVIYRPESERWSHYQQARLTRQFDALIHIDETAALQPLEREGALVADALDTYPRGL